MELVVEHGGRSFDLLKPAIRAEFDAYVQTLPTKEEQYAVNGMALKAIDMKLHTLGIYCGVPVVNPESASESLYGYILRIPQKEAQDEGGLGKEKQPRVINSWHFKDKKGRRGQVIIYEGADGRRFHRVGYGSEDWKVRFEWQISSMLARLKSNPLQAEMKAQVKLRSLITEHQYAMYIASGLLIEIGRSGVWYAVRRGLPTIAFRHTEGKADVLAALCLKPIGGHKRTFAGVMTPTDEVITTVLLIKADEHGLWKTANHIDIDNPVSGL